MFTGKASKSGRRCPGLVLEWRECAGLMYAADQDRFGSRLVKASVQQDLGEALTFDDRPDGMVCRIAARFRPITDSKLRLI